MGIRVSDRWLEGRAILEQAVQDIDRFPDAAGDKVAEERNIRIANMMIGLSERPNYAKERYLAFVIIGARSINLRIIQ